MRVSTGSAARLFAEAARAGAELCSAFERGSVDVAEIAAGLDDVADPLLQLLRPGKAAVALALPDEIAVDADLEIAAGAGDQRYFAEAVGKSIQQLLRHPAGAQQPVALGTVEDRDTGFFGHGDFLSFDEI